MSDVDNPLTGEHGATAVFGPQKGVTPEQIARRSTPPSPISPICSNRRCTHARAINPARARRAASASRCICSARRFEPGAEVVAREVGLDAALEGAELADHRRRPLGRADAAWQGAVHRLPARAGAGVAATLLSGAIDPAALPRFAEHFSGCFSPAPGPITLEVAIRDAATLLANEAEQLTRLKFGAR